MTISPEGGLAIVRHGTAYTSSPAGKLQELKQFAIHIDLTTLSDGQDSLAKIFGCLNSQVDQNIFVGQWQDGIELHVRTERNPGGMIYGADGVLEKEKRTSCLIMYDGQKMHLYANGALIRRDQRGSLSFSNWSKEYPLVIGTDANGRSQWRGTIYEVAVFDRAVTPEEVQGLRVLRVQGNTGSGVQGLTGSGAEQEYKKPLIRYVFKKENTYETTFRGKKALAVRDLGKGVAADLVIPEQFMPYKRVYLGWDSDWTKRSSDWMDLVVNIVGFVPFGLLLTLAFRNGLRSVKCQVLSEGEKGDKNRKILGAVVLAVVVGFGVSLTIEWLQAYLPARDSSLRDLITNVLGSLMGALAAAWLVSRRKAEISV